MELEVGQIVRSKAGRDRDSLLMVVSAQKGFALVCDGKERPLERPKRKNVKHIQQTGMRLDAQAIATNRALKKALAALRRDEA